MEPSLALAGPLRFKPAATATCFHCGLPVDRPGLFPVEVLGSRREMCCAGCQAVARTILDAGFEDYYETRDQPSGERPAGPELLPVSLYDDPLAQRQFVAAMGEHEREAVLALEGIRCVACAWLNERVLRTLPGVTGVTINYATRRAQVGWDQRVTGLGRIIATVRSLGYDAFPFDPEKQRLRDKSDRRAALWRLFVAGFGAMQVMMYAVPRYIDDTGTLSAEADQVMRWASLVLTVPVMLFSCGPFFNSALADLRARRVGMDVPVSLGIVCGFGASAWATFSGRGEVYFDSITMLVFLLLGSRYLELAARRSASSRLDYLARWMPSFALRLREGAQPERVQAQDLRPGDQTIVAPGEIIPADGIVLSGQSAADESLLTGESDRVPKGPGADVIGGSINVEQPLVIEVTHAGPQTRAAAIGRLIERAAAGRPRLVAAADRIAGALTWVVLAAAGAAFVGWLTVEPGQAFWAAIAVLMVACPCALGLAAPIALTAVTGSLAKRGVAVTNAQAIESLARITDVVLDKTGTLTEAAVSLVHVDAMGPLGADACTRLAGALEAGSAHPLANCLASASGAGRMPAISSPTLHAGQGIEAIHEGARVRIGSFGFVQELAGLAPVMPAVGTGQPHVFLGGEGGWLARFSFDARLRPGAVQLVEGLRSRGLTVHLLSGDDPGVVEAVGNRLGIAIRIGGASPDAKHAYVARLQAEGRRVAMLGDGLNDAPVLAQADVSIAMGQGAMLAQQQADLVLLSGRLTAVFDALQVARKAMRVIKENFAWALAYNAAAIPLAAFGWIGPWEAAAGMAASSLLVAANSARLAVSLR